VRESTAMKTSLSLAALQLAVWWQQSQCFIAQATPRAVCAVCSSSLRHKPHASRVRPRSHHVHVAAQRCAVSMTSEVQEQTTVGGLPLPTKRELVRFELKQVPAAAARRFLMAWGERRVPDRPDVTDPGVPSTNMPVTSELLGGTGSKMTGLRLVFDATPTDAVDINFYPLAGGSSALIMSRVEGGSGKAGGLGPQVASLISSAENTIRVKLQADVDAYARNYTRSRKAGALPDTAAADDDADAAAESTNSRSSSSSSSSSSSAEPQQQRSPEPLPDSAFAGGVMYDDLLDAFPGGKQAFNLEAFAAFEAARGAVTDETVTDETIDNTQGAGVKGFEGVLQSLYAANSSESQLAALFTAGAELAAAGAEDQMQIPAQQDLVQLEVMLGPGTRTRGGLDIMAGPPKAIGGEFDTGVAESETRRYAGSVDDSSSSSSSSGSSQQQQQQQVYTMYDEDDVPVLELTEAELNAIDPDLLELQMARLDGLLYELGRAPTELRPTILAEYNDVLLDEYYVLAMRARIPRLESDDQRSLLLQVNDRAVLLVQQLAAMKQAQEVQELEKIRSICECAMQDMSRLPDTVRSMKPLLNAEFVAYLAYAIEKERKELRRQGFNPDREPSRWLQVSFVYFNYPTSLY
jgi:hypothetical protein